MGAIRARSALLDVDPRLGLDIRPLVSLIEVGSEPCRITRHTRKTTVRPMTIPASEATHTPLSVAMIEQILGDLCQHALDRLRPEMLNSPWEQDDRLARQFATLDSIERVELGAIVSSFFGLDEADGARGLFAAPNLAGLAKVVHAEQLVGDPCIGFRTSGSSGQPKLIRHPLSRLLQEADTLARLFSSRRRLLLAVPTHHIYGFIFGILLPTRLGAATRSLQRLPPGSLLREAQRGDLVVGTPFLLGLAFEAGISVPDDVWAVTSTAPCPDPVWERASERGIARLIEVYGSTETGGVGTRDAPGQPFELLSHLDAAGAGGVIERSGNDGTGTESVRCPDRMEWLAERRFRVLGRHDGAVQIAGVNVYPERVRRVILECPLVKEATVRLMRPGEGKRLKAFVVPRSLIEQDRVRRELDAHLAVRLSAPERPRSITVGEALPRTSEGKLCDWMVTLGPLPEADGHI